MRRLAQPEVLKSALLAAAISAGLCLPRLWFWPTRKYPLWYLEAILFLGGTVLWAFVFAWQAHYSARPVLTFKIAPGLWAAASATGLTIGLLLLWLVDPQVRARTPEDYPTTWLQWLAMTLFTLAFTQLLLVFAPVAWLLRLFKNKALALVLTIAFGIMVLMVKNHSSATPVPMGLLSALVAVRIVTTGLSLYLYWQGGVVLVWWWIFLLQSRHLLPLLSHE